VLLRISKSCKRTDSDGFFKNPRIRTRIRILDSVDRLRPPLDTRPLCVRRCVHAIGQSHNNRRGADCTLASWDGKIGR